MSKTVTIGILLFLVVLFGFAFISNREDVPTSPLLEETPQQPIPTQTQAVDKQASFAIFTNGTFRVFTAAMYHNLSQDVYIEAKNPNVIQMRKDSITWNDFFSTLPFQLTHECLTTGTKETFCTGSNGTLKFYLNGSQEINVLDREINVGDQLLVTFGRENEGQIQKQFQRIPRTDI